MFPRNEIETICKALELSPVTWKVSDTTFGVVRESGKWWVVTGGCHRHHTITEHELTVLLHAAWHSCDNDSKTLVEKAEAIIRKEQQQQAAIPLGPGDYITDHADHAHLIIYRAGEWVVGQTLLNGLYTYQRFHVSYAQEHRILIAKITVNMPVQIVGAHTHSEKSGLVIKVRDSGIYDICLATRNIVTAERNYLIRLIA